VVDTHAHLSICEPPDEQLVTAAARAGVHRILTIGLDEASNREAIDSAEAHEGVFAGIGRHPNSATGFDDAAATDLEKLAANPVVRAIGETGLDYYRDGAARADQMRAFEAQIEIARKLDLALVVHLRDRDDSDQAGGAIDDAFELLVRRAEGVTVILHCFSAAARVEEAVQRGWLCSFAGNVTFPSAGPLRDAAAAVPEDLLLVETDAPFLAPQPRRGKPNAPEHVVATAEVVAQARGIEYEQLERSVEANAGRALGW
jgi:TatD DNase family protein